MAGSTAKFLRPSGDRGHAVIRIWRGKPARRSKPAMVEREETVARLPCRFEVHLSHIKAGHMVLLVGMADFFGGDNEKSCRPVGTFAGGNRDTSLFAVGQAVRPALPISPHYERIIIPGVGIRLVGPRHSRKGILCAVATEGVKSRAPKGLPPATTAAIRLSETMYNRLTQSKHNLLVVRQLFNC